MSDSFATTRWTLVLNAVRNADVDTRAESGGQALDELCRLYWPPLYAHARRQGRSPTDAEDAVQGFFARLLRLESLASARRDRGRFRSFLLGAFNHYLADLHDHAHAEKRGAHLLPSLDTAATEAALASAPAGGSELPPDRAFDRAWALALLDAVTVRLRSDYARTERSDHLEALLPCLAGRNADASHLEIARKLGLTEPALRVAIYRLRQRYRQLLREEVAQTVAKPEDVDQELRHLIAALAMTP